MMAYCMSGDIIPFCGTATRLALTGVTVDAIGRVMAAGNATGAERQPVPAKISRFQSIGCNWPHRMLRSIQIDALKGSVG
jgi:hypothetical protein